MAEQQTELLEPVIFEYNGSTYLYDRERITVEQAEIAKEILEFRYNAGKNPPRDVRQLFGSRSIEWCLMVLSYLLLKKDGDAILPFDIDKVPEVEKFVKSLPLKFYEKLKECVSDFFSCIGSNSIYSQVNTNAKTLNVSEILSALIPLMMAKNGVNTSGN